MSKPVHPIKRMQQAINRGAITDIGGSKEREVIARHVKPLLDALDLMHRHAFDHAAETSGQCEGCRILVAWRAKP